MNIRVLIIGGDGRVKLLLDALKGNKGITFIGVSDVDGNSPGMKYARELGLSTSVDLSRFVIENKPDIIIETSGSKQFQKILNQVTTKETKIIDAKAAELLLDVARDKERAKRHGQLHIIKELSDIFSAEYDARNIVRPVFKLLKEHFDIDVEAVFILYGEKDELTVMSDHGINRDVSGQILEFLRQNGGPEIRRELTKGRLEIFTQALSIKPYKLKKLKSFISIPLITRSGSEGIMVLARAKDEPFDPEDVIVLNILGEELALFIENEKAKRELADSKANLESMMHSMSEGVIALNERKEVTLVNPAAKAILGLRDIKLARPIWESITDKRAIEIYQSVLTGESLSAREITILSDNEQKTVKMYCARVKDALGNEKGWVILLADITKEKKIDKMKSEFISTTSHELRTPLAAIKESVTLVYDRTAGGITPLQERFLGVAERNIDRLTYLINDLLDISKIEAGKMQLNKVKCEIKKVAENALDSLKVFAEENIITIAKEIAEGLPEVKCDPNKIAQVVTNLVGNSIKFTPPKGRIKITVKMASDKDLEGAGILAEISSALLRPGFIIVSVQDTGVGIEKKDIPKLFARFGQLDSSLTRKRSGTGLGLAISRELIRMHGGEIWAKSKPGKGSTFSFVLPVESREKGMNAAR